MSTETRFTRGPWEASGNVIFRSDNHNSVAVVTVHKADMSENSEAASTARLIATTPEMYGILYDIFSNEGLMPDTLGKINHLFNKINQ